MTKKRISRRVFLQGIGAMGSLIRISLPPLIGMFNSHGTAYAAETAAGKITETAIEPRFVFWFNGNGIPEKHWIPLETGPDYTMTPCLSPLAPFRKDIHVISGLDNLNGSKPGPGNDHLRSMAALVSGEPFTGRGAAGPSIDQAIAAKIGGKSRFRSVQVGVCQESFGAVIQRNMSWAGRDRPLPPVVVPHKLFDRLFGTRDHSWVNRKQSVLDFVYQDAARLQANLGRQDRLRVDEYLTSVRDLERAIVNLPTEYAQEIEEPEAGGDPLDYPKIAKLQSDLLAHAFISGQTRVASYMLTKCQGLTRFPWLGLTGARHHEYSHSGGPWVQQEVMREICRWHAEEFAYLVAKLRSVPEGDGTLLDHCCLLYVHEHAEANPHKDNGHAVIVAGHAGGLVTGTHTQVTGTLGDLYLTLANKVLGANLEGYPSAFRTLSGLVG